MKYNAIENAERFIAEQIEWCKTNGYENLTIWSNGIELRAKVDEDNIYSRFMDFDFERDGYWKAIQFVDGHRVEY